MISRQFVILIASLSLLLPTAPAGGADFALGFDGVPERVVGAPGEVKTFDAFLTLTTTNNQSPDGAQGWLLLLKIEGGHIGNLSLEGIVVSTIYDEDQDQDPITPPIHHDPYLFDLDGSSLKSTVPKNIATECAISMVVMKSDGKMFLQPSGTQRIGKLTVQTTIPTKSKCAPLRIWYENPPEFRAACANLLVEGAARHTVIWQGQSFPPELSSSTVLVCPPLFRRGDSNSDSLVDISDAIHLLNSLFLGGPLPGCRDAADVNDDATIDLSDPVYLLVDLFLPQLVSGVPDPGPYACGGDPTADDLGCERTPCLAP